MIFEDQFMKVTDRKCLEREKILIFCMWVVHDVILRLNEQPAINKTREWKSIHMNVKVFVLAVSAELFVNFFPFLSDLRLEMLVTFCADFVRKLKYFQDNKQNMLDICSFQYNFLLLVPSKRLKLVDVLAFLYITN